MDSRQVVRLIEKRETNEDFFRDLEKALRAAQDALENPDLVQLTKQLLEAGKVETCLSFTMEALLQGCRFALFNARECGVPAAEIPASSTESTCLAPSTCQLLKSTRHQQWPYTQGQALLVYSRFHQAFLLSCTLTGMQRLSIMQPLLHLLIGLTIECRNAAGEIESIVEPISQHGLGTKFVDDELPVDKILHNFFLENEDFKGKIKKELVRGLLDKVRIIYLYAPDKHPIDMNWHVYAFCRVTSKA